MALDNDFINEEDNTIVDIICEENKECMALIQDLPSSISNSRIYSGFIRDYFPYNTTVIIDDNNFTMYLYKTSRVYFRHNARFVNFYFTSNSKEYRIDIHTDTIIIYTGIYSLIHGNSLREVVTSLCFR